MTVNLEILCRRITRLADKTTRKSHDRSKLDRDSNTTCYGLEGPGIESRCGWDFQYPSIPALGPTHPPAPRVPGHFLGKVVGEGSWPSIHT